MSSMKIGQFRNQFHESLFIGLDYIMASHAIVVVKDIILLFYHGNAVILTLR